MDSFSVAIANGLTKSFKTTNAIKISIFWVISNNHAHNGMVYRCTYTRFDFGV